MSTSIRLGEAKGFTISTCSASVSIAKDVLSRCSNQCVCFTKEALGSLISDWLANLYIWWLLCPGLLLCPWSFGNRITWITVLPTGSPCSFVCPSNPPLLAYYAKRDPALIGWWMISCYRALRPYYRYTLLPAIALGRPYGQLVTRCLSLTSFVPKDPRLF